jgi:hypothetical protein
MKKWLHRLAGVDATGFRPPDVPSATRVNPMVALRDE